MSKVATPVGPSRILPATSGHVLTGVTVWFGTTLLTAEVAIVGGRRSR
jgi:hypothetical protein